MSDDSYTPSTEEVRSSYNLSDSDKARFPRLAWDQIITVEAFDRWLAGYDAALLASVTPADTEYGRRDRRYGDCIALRGAPTPEWWGESQTDWEHVQRQVGPWVPVPTEGEGEK